MPGQCGEGVRGGVTPAGHRRGPKAQLSAGWNCALAVRAHSRDRIRVVERVDQSRVGVTVPVTVASVA